MVLSREVLAKRAEWEWKGLQVTLPWVQEEVWFLVVMWRVILCVSGIPSSSPVTTQAVQIFRRCSYTSIGWESIDQYSWILVLTFLMAFANSWNSAHRRSSGTLWSIFHEGFLWLWGLTPATHGSSSVFAVEGWCCIHGHKSCIVNQAGMIYISMISWTICCNLSTMWLVSDSALTIY